MHDGNAPPASPTPPAPPAPPDAAEVFRRLGPAGYLALASGVLPILGSIALFAYADAIETRLASLGPSGLIVFALCFALAAGLTIIPTYAASALGGYMFEVSRGLPASLAGFALGSLLGYELGRRASGERAMVLINENPKWRAVRDALVDDRGNARGFWKTLGMVALLRAPPNSPFAIMNLLMASVKVPRAPYLLGTLLGMTPRTFGYVAIGAGISHAFTKDAVKEASPSWLIWVSIGAGLVVLCTIGHIANRAIAKVTAGTRADAPS